jgi:hypothetical protein
LQQQQQRPKRGNIVVEKKGACFKRISMTMVRIEKRRRRRSVGHIFAEASGSPHPDTGYDPWLG